MVFFNRVQKQRSYYPARLQGQIFGTSIDLSVDTGSSLSFMSEEVFNELTKTRPDILLFPCTKMSSAADSSTLRTTYSANLELHLSFVKFTHSFYVTKGLIIPVVLGVDFLLNHQAILNFEDNTISFKNLDFGIDFDYNINTTS